MSIFNSMSVSTLIVLLVAGLMVGVSASGTDLLNPYTSAAEANRANIETAHQQAVYQLQERLATAQTEAEIKEIQRQQILLEAKFQHDLQALNQDLAHRDLAFKVWMNILTLLAGTFAITLSIVSIVWVGSRTIVYLRSIPIKEEAMPKSTPPIEKKIIFREPYDPLDAKAILYANRINERLQEVAAEHKEPNEEELLVRRMKALSRDANMGSEENKKRPLAR